MRKKPVHALKSALLKPLKGQLHPLSGVGNVKEVADSAIDIPAGDSAFHALAMQAAPGYGITIETEIHGHKRVDEEPVFRVALRQDPFDVAERPLAAASLIIVSVPRSLSTPYQGCGRRWQREPDA